MEATDKEATHVTNIGTAAVLADVIIVAHNSANVLGSCISAVKRAMNDPRIIVVDNASNDDSVDVARAAGVDTVVSLAHNVGFGRACNVGAERSGADWLLLLNPDCLLTQVDAIALTEAVAQPSVSVIVPRRFAEANSEVDASPLRGHEEHLLEFIKFALTPIGLGPACARVLRLGRKPRWASAACVFVRRSAYSEVGGFDPSFFLYFEDRDLSERLYARGYAPLATDAVAVAHSGQASSEGSRELLVRRQALVWLAWGEYVAARHAASVTRLAWRAGKVARFGVRLTLNALALAFKRDRRWERKCRELRAIDQEVLELLPVLAEHGFHTRLSAALSDG